MAQVIVCETLTGVEVGRVEVAGGSWKSSLTLPGEGSFSIPLRDQLRPVPASLVERLDTGWATTLVVEDDRGWIDYAGVVTDADWDSASGVLEVSTLEVGAILEHRLLFGVPHYAQGTKVLTGRDLGEVIVEAYRWSMRGYGGIWDLPVTFPARTGGSVSREYLRFNFQSAAAFLDQLQAEDGAPDAHLRPYWIEPGRLAWRLEIGDPLLHGEAHGWAVATPGHRVKSPVTGYARKLSFRGQRTGIFAVGAGSEEDMLHRTAGRSEVPGPSGLPALDAVVQFKSVDDRAVLKSHALAELRAARYGTAQRSFSVETGGQLVPVRRQVQVGSVVTLRHPGDEIEPAGEHSQYVLSVAGSVGSTLRQVESQSVR